MKQKTILIIHPHFTIPGGAGRVVLELGKRLSKKYRIIAIAQQVKTEYRRQYPEIGFESLNGPLTGSFAFWLFFLWWRWRTAKVIDQYRKRGNVAIVCNSFPSNWIGLSLKHRYPEIKITWYCHEPSAFIHIKEWRQAIRSPVKRMAAEALAPIFAMIDKRLVGKADEIFMNSQFTQKNARAVYGQSGKVVYPGIDKEFFKPVPSNQKKHYVLTVGRLSKYKRVDLLIKAFSLVHDKKLKLMVLGDGEEIDVLKSLARECGVEKRIVFLRPVYGKMLAKYFAEAKIVVSASRNETFGLVLCEAMAAGTAVISDDSGGPREIINDNVTGRLIKCTEGKLADEINRLCGDKKQLMNYSKSARKDIIERFDWDKSALKLEKSLF